MNLESLIASVKSLFNKDPYHSNSKDEARHYKTIFSHETIRVAVIDVMEKKDVYNEYFVEKMKNIFNHNCDHYIKVCVENMHFDGKAMNERLRYFLGGIRGTKFQFENLLGKLEGLKNERSHS